MKNVVLLGGTGSIGENTLAVLRKFPEEFKLFGVVAHQNIEKLYAIIKEFRPEYACLTEPNSAKQLSQKINKESNFCKILSGMEGAEEIASHANSDIVISGISGANGLLPTLAAVEAGKTVGIANKEPLVMAGDLIVSAAKKNNAFLLPVDSEHSAIHQCLAGSDKGIHKIWLTASGGPFRNWNQNQLENAKIEEALKHPTWNMGSKITIDSATLMNKALEIIEAHWLFKVPCNNIQVIVQPSSIIHSMVEFIDGSTIAQLGVPSMELPIQYALTYPQRLKGNVKAPDWLTLGSLIFEKPNPHLSRALEFAYQAAEEGGAMGVVLNASNEIAVKHFLEKKISFLQIYDLIKDAMKNYKGTKASDLDDITKIDLQVRQEFNLWKI